MSDLLKFLSGSFLGNLAEAALILIAGLIFIKIASSIMKRALSRSHLDEAVHKFIINVIRAVLYIVLTVAILGKLIVPTAPRSGSGHSAGSQRQPWQYSRRRTDTGQQAF